MIRSKWSVALRNKLATMSGECDSAAAIEGAKMTQGERAELQKLLRKAIDFINDRI